MTYRAVLSSHPIKPDSLAKPALVALSNQVILPCILGQRHAFSLITKGGGYAGPLALGGFISFLVALYVSSPTLRRLRLLAAVWLMVSSLAIALAARDSVRTLLPDFGHAIRFGSDRYFFCASCMFLYCLALGAERWGRAPLASRPRNAAYFALLFALSGVVNFHIGPARDLHWAMYAPAIDDWRRARKDRERHASLSVPVNPEPWRIDLPAIP